MREIRNRSGLRKRRQRGAEMMEFTLVFLPLLMMLLVLMDISWAVFAKSTLEYAVRTGVRTGITITGTQATAAGGCLTDIVKAKVQSNALGILAGSSGLSKIKVHYYLPSGTSTAPTDVSTQSDGNKPLNIMQVTIQGFTLRALVPRIWNWGSSGVDDTSEAIYAASADLIEASRDVPCIGTAP
jgi:Flp pilus assembly protein TadG